MQVLVITDNFAQYNRAHALIARKALPDVVFTFRHSPGRSPLQGHLPGGAVDVVTEQEWIIAQFDLVISIHCLQFFPARLVQAVRCVNVHPGYNPVNRGWYPQVFAIVHGLEIGATIHEMDEKLDHGPIIAQTKVEQHEGDTSLHLYTRVLDAEMHLLEEQFERIIYGTYATTVPATSGYFFSKADHNALLELDLDRTGTFREFYNLLRALSHPPYKNAFFRAADGRKVFVRLETEIEGGAT